MEEKVIYVLTQLLIFLLVYFLSSFPPYSLTYLFTNLFKDTHRAVLLKDNQREKSPSNKTPVLSRSMNMHIWVVGTPNQFFIRGY